MNTCITGRFAPSPSGRMHVGNLFSSLVSVLVAANLARDVGGEWRMVMRMENLDPERTSQAWIDQLFWDMEWFGFEWDSAMFQGQREEAYLQAYEALNTRGLVYPCYCSRADLHSASAPHRGEEYLYSGRCRNLNAAAAERLAAEQLARTGHGPAKRVRVRAGEALQFDDYLCGPQTLALDEPGDDFVVRRGDDVFAYQLAVVVDDAAQGVNSVTRGCDLLSVSFKQMFLQRELGLPQPTYAHLPLIVAADGSRLSKRNRDVTLAHLIDEASLEPAEILGHLAWISGLIESYEPMSLSDLVECANLDALRGRESITWVAPV